MTNDPLWKKCAEFHGHECPGLTIGYKASLLAAKLLGTGFSHDERLVCISENDACGIDAISVLLGCSLGKGNLLFHMTGKQAFSFYDRESSRSFRLVLKPFGPFASKADAFEYYHSLTPEEMFDVKETSIKLPQKAAVFQNIVCPVCGESFAEGFAKITGGRALCPDCAHTFSRLNA